MTASTASHKPACSVPDAASTVRIDYQGKPLDAYTKKDLIALIGLLIADYDLLEAELAEFSRAVGRALSASSRGFVRGRLLDI